MIDRPARLRLSSVVVVAVVATVVVTVVATVVVAVMAADQINILSMYLFDSKCIYIYIYVKY